MQIEMKFLFEFEPSLCHQIASFIRANARTSCTASLCFFFNLNIGTRFLQKISTLKKINYIVKSLKLTS